MIQIEADLNLSCLLYKMDELATRIKSYRGDLMADAAIIATNEANAIAKGKRQSGSTRFIWQVRESGTYIHEIKPDQMELVRICAAQIPNSDFFLIERQHDQYTISSLSYQEVMDMARTEVNPQ